MKNSKFENHLLLKNGKSINKRFIEDKYLPYIVFGSNGVIGYTNTYNVEENSIIIGRVGANCGSIQFSKDKSWATDNTIVATVKSNNDPKYWFYLLSSLNLRNFAIGSAQPMLKQSIINSLEFKIHDYYSQKVIGNLLSTLDAKIELNNQINEKLEETAKAIYNEWFVNFNFPDENGLPYKDNGGQFYETELGEIPIGWEVKYLSEITYFKNGINYNNDNVYNNDYRIINVKDITNSNYLASNTSLESIDIDSNSAEKYLVNHLDTIMARSANAGKVLLYLGNEQNTVYSGFSILIRSLNNNTAYYIFSFCQNIINYLVAYSNGTIFKNISQGVLKAIKLALPNQNILDKYNSIVSKIYKQIANKSTEIEKLNNLKNLLLNKLMSGQIDVDKLNIDWDKLDKTLKEVENLV